MPDKLDQAVESQIRNLEQKTGKTLEEWIVITRASGLKKHKEMVKFLQSEHGLTYGYANMVVLKAKETETPGQAQEQDLVAGQYAGEKSALRPIFDALLAAVTSFGSDVIVSPKKAYVSLRRDKQFAIVQPSTKERVDLGINLKGVQPGGRLEASGRFNAMVSHRVRLSSLDQVDGELLGWLKAAYEEA
ncbi:MAG TPA: DUF5655 domain-containing protein [Anaerolineales bacterium]|nr:DUF5655 domain-containing protein [Anaerolineales bacterium]